MSFLWRQNQFVPCDNLFRKVEQPDTVESGLFVTSHRASLENSLNNQYGRTSSVEFNGFVSHLRPLCCETRLSLLDTANVGIKLLPISLWTNTKKVEQRVKVGERVDDGCTGQTPSEMSVEIASCLGSSGLTISDDMGLIQYDSVPHCLEKRSWKVSVADQA